MQKKKRVLKIYITADYNYMPKNKWNVEVPYNKGVSSKVIQVRTKYISKSGKVPLSIDACIAAETHIGESLFGRLLSEKYLSKWSFEDAWKKNIFIREISLLTEILLNTKIEILNTRHSRTNACYFWTGYFIKSERKK